MTLTSTAIRAVVRLDRLLLRNDELEPPLDQDLGINPIVTLEKQLLNMIGNLV
jgi:hypothetical protein